MAGKSVYPGSKVGQEDCLKELIPCCKGLSPKKTYQMLDEEDLQYESIAYWISAIRELFEESGILLAYNQMGISIHFPNPAERDKCLNYRKLLSIMFILLKYSPF